MLEQFGKADCNPVHTPMNPGSKLSVSMCPANDSEHEFMLDKPYRNAVAALNYLAATCLSGISYTVGKLARFNANPGPQHCTA